MKAEIKYNGYTASPGDYECADGDLAITLGLINEDGAMKPILPPSEELNLGADKHFLYIHKGLSYSNYIYRTLNKSTYETELCYYNRETGSGDTLYSTTENITSITSLGNTLVVLASNGMHYLLWNNNEYLDLGSEIPECSLSFGLQGSFERSEEFTISFNGISSSNLYEEFTDENKATVTEQVLAKVNKFIADKSTKKGKFIYPFLLRYAYRLYDGTLTKHSAPILMVASSDLAPQCFWNKISGSGSYSSAKLEIASVLHVLDYAVESSTELAELKNWKDIVRSIDIFISKPIYTYDQNGQCTGFANNEDANFKKCYAICKHTNQKASTEHYPLRYQFNEFRKLYAFTEWDSNTETAPTYPEGRLLLPRRSTDEVKADIKNCSSFYFLESIKVEQLTTTRTIINVKEDYLESLVAREVMTDDYDTHDKLYPQYALPYNSRINIANLRKRLYQGYNPYSLFTYSDGYINYGTISDADDIRYKVTIYVYIKQDGKDIIVKSDEGRTARHAPLIFFYYPNINAYKAVIHKQYSNYGTVESWLEIPLEQHAFLNGAFYFSGWDDLNKGTSSTSASSDAQRTVNIPNKIYTSEVNNPFYFPLLGINTVGTGEIRGISTAAKALSEGQFGQFPLYAFTDEGVWALEVSNTGTYTAKQPITRDVVVNSASITPIDTAVLFITNKGIMHLSGSTSQCISDTLDNEELFDLTTIPKYETLLSIYNKQATEAEQITLDNITMLPFSDFIANGRMLYDYTNQRIIVYNPLVRYSYVYSLKSRTWGMMRSSITGTLNSYPEALAIDTNCSVVNFSTSDAENTTSLIITRPFKIDDPNTFKSIETIIQRGMFLPTHVKQVLSGSNDLIHWHPIWTSVDKIMRGFRGTPYKTFRLALICAFDKSESLYGCTVVYEPRLGNKVR